MSIVPSKTSHQIVTCLACAIHSADLRCRQRNYTPCAARAATARSLRRARTRGRLAGRATCTHAFLIWSWPSLHEAHA